MLKTRLWVGSLLALGAAGVLFGDSWLARHGFAWFPFLLGFLLLAGVLAPRELVRLFPEPQRPSELLVTAGVLLCLLANWYPLMRAQFAPAVASPWAMLVCVFAGALAGAFLIEMGRYTGEPGAVARVALAALALGYLGLLPAFFAQVRFLSPDAENSAVMLALVVFVPKGNDIGAYFAGRLFGRRPMTPVLSPKKTWEGFAGGMLAGAGVAAGLGQLAPVFPLGRPEAVAFGLLVGAAGVLGDLAESLIKREAGAKDASARLPGFGGLLDVVDSVLFAAPVAYLWFSLNAAR